MKNTLTVRLMDKNFNFLGEIDDFEEFLFYRKYITFGDFEGVIDKRKNNTEHLRVGNLLFIDGARAGIIEHREDVQDGGDEQILIRGYTLERFLYHRLTIPPKGKAEWTMTGPVETVIKALVSYNLGEAAGEKRHVAEIVVAPDSGRGEEVTFATAYRPLDEDLKGLCMDNGVGVAITFDTVNRRYVFDVVFGENRTVEQRENPPVIFASEFDNILEQRVIDSTLDYKNTAITGGSGEGASREIIVVYEGEDEPTGIDRREVFADIRDSTVTSKTLPDKGRDKLGESPKIFTLEGIVNPFQQNAVLGEHYDLGDIVTRKYGEIVKDTRVTEITESWDGGDYSLECTFGEPFPTLLDKIKNGVKS